MVSWGFFVRHNSYIGRHWLNRLLLLTINTCWPCSRCTGNLSFFTRTASCLSGYSPSGLTAISVQSNNLTCTCSQLTWKKTATGTRVTECTTGNLLQPNRATALSHSRHSTTNGQPANGYNKTEMTYNFSLWWTYENPAHWFCQKIIIVPQKPESWGYTGYFYLCWLSKGRNFHGKGI